MFSQPSRHPVLPLFDIAVVIKESRQRSTGTSRAQPLPAQRCNMSLSTRPCRDSTTKSPLPCSEVFPVSCGHEAPMKQLPKTTNIHWVLLQAIRRIKLTSSCSNRNWPLPKSEKQCQLEKRRLTVFPRDARQKNRMLENNALLSINAYLCKSQCSHTGPSKSCHSAARTLSRVIPASVQGYKAPARTSATESFYTPRQGNSEWQLRTSTRDHLLPANPASGNMRTQPCTRSAAMK